MLSLVNSTFDVVTSTKLPVVLLGDVVSTVLCTAVIGSAVASLLKVLAKAVVGLLVCVENSVALSVA